jgi:hypothetical protein
MPRINDQFLDSVFYLYPNRSAAERGERAGGTGFWASYVSDIAANTIVIFAVSNKHVVADGGASVIRVNNRDGGIHTFELEPHEWHFTNKDDIAIVNISVDLAKQRIITIPLSMFVTKEVMKGHDLGPGDEVFMVGRFISHDGHLTNIPSVRFGNMSIDEASLDHPFIGAQDSFAVEMRSMAGYSGSPVFIYPSQWNMNTGAVAIGSGSLFLLGINWGYVVDDVEIEERSVPSSQDNKTLSRRTSYIRTNTGMNGVVPAWRIADMIRENPWTPSIRAKEEAIAERDQVNSPAEGIRTP